LQSQPRLANWMIVILVVHICRSQAETVDTARLATTDKPMLEQCVALHRAMIDVLQNGESPAPNNRLIAAAANVRPFLQAYEFVIHDPLVVHADMVTGMGAVNRL